MLASLLIVFREVLEAGLIVGIVLAATQGIRGRGAWVAGGIGAGTSGAMLLATFAGTLSSALAGLGQEVFTSSILVVAILMLGWHQIWMAGHGRQIAQEMKAMGHAVALGRKSLLAMAVVVAIAVLREGAEVVLFIYGIAVSSSEGLVSLLVGGALGVGLGAVVAWLLYCGLLAIPLHRLFSVTSWLIALLAAGMAGQAAAVLAGADLIPAWGYQLWDTTWLLSQDSLAGRALRALIGYSDRPMGVQLVAYVFTLATLLIGARLVQGTDRIRIRVMRSAAPPSVRHSEGRQA
jgi:high-affinity iron transporter